MKRLLPIVLLRLMVIFLTSAPAWAQREGVNWHFGQNVALSFATGEPVALSRSQINTREGCASMSDADGNLLFYSDGATVWTFNHTVMTNGTGLMGDNSSTQSCIVVPWPNKPGMFYLFTVDNAESGYVDGLRYSVINMNVMSGYGAVEEKNVLLDAPTAEKVTAVRHSNGEDVWVIGHQMHTSIFVVYLVTENGITMQPIAQDVGPILAPMDCGYLKSNLQGNRLAMACAEQNGLFLFAFDNSTGVISDPLTLSSAVTYGIEFSPNGRYLYASSWVDWPIYQFDLSLPPSSIGPRAVAIAPTRRRGALQLAPNGRIYSVTPSSTNLDAIDAPDQGGTACRFVNRAFVLPSSAALGLPNFFPTVLTSDVRFELRVNDACVGDTVTAELRPHGKAKQIRWEMGEPGYVADSADTLERIGYVYRIAGVHTVTVHFVTPSGIIDSITTSVEILSRPDITKSADTTICLGGSARIEAGSSGTLRWLPHPDIIDQTQASMLVRPQTTTTYHVETTNGLCTASDSVTVVVIPIETITIGDTIVTVRPGERLTIPFSGPPRAEQLLPLRMELRSDARIGTVDVIPDSGITIVDRTSVGTMNVVTVDVTSIAAPPTMVTLDVLPLLNAGESNIDVFVSGDGCVIDGSAKIILVSENCAGPIRNVTVGPEALSTITILPNPIESTGTIRWQSPMIGEHDVRIFTTEGVLVSTYSFSRTVDSPTGGEISFDRTGLAAGLYLVVLTTRMGSTSLSSPLHVY